MTFSTDKTTNHSYQRNICRDSEFTPKHPRLNSIVYAGLHTILGACYFIRIQPTCNQNISNPI